MHGATEPEVTAETDGDVVKTTYLALDCQSRSVSVWVGWACEPSPALITGTRAFMAATYAAPSSKWHIAMMSAKQLITFDVSATVSPPC